MRTRTRLVARLGAGAAAGLAALMWTALTAAAAMPPPNTGTWANASNMQWNCTATGPANTELSCQFQGPASCTETDPSGNVLGGCAVTLSTGSATLLGCSGAGSGVFAYSPSVGAFATASVTISVNGGAASIAGSWNDGTSSGTVSASFAFVCPLPTQSGAGRVNWSGQVNES